MTPEDAQGIVRQLDSMFNRKTSFIFSPMSFFNATHYRGHILVEGDERALHPQIIAHEYAHRITRRTRKEPHTKTFFVRYKRVCSYLGIEPSCASVRDCENLRLALGI